MEHALVGCFDGVQAGPRTIRPATVQDPLSLLCVCHQSRGNNEYSQRIQLGRRAVIADEVVILEEVDIIGKRWPSPDSSTNPRVKHKWPVTPLLGYASPTINEFARPDVKEVAVFSAEEPHAIGIERASIEGSVKGTPDGPLVVSPERGLGQPQ